MKSCNKLSTSVCIKSFPNVGTNTGAGTYRLVGQNRFPSVGLHFIAQSDYFPPKALDLSSKMLLLIKSLFSIRRRSRHLN